MEDLNLLWTQQKRRLHLSQKSLWRFTPEEAARLKELGEDDGLVTRDWQKTLQRNELLGLKSNWRRTESVYGAWLEAARETYAFAPQLWNQSLHLRHWKLLRWLDQPFRPVAAGGSSGIEDVCLIPRHRAALANLCLARCEGGATDADLLEQLLGDRNESGYYGGHNFTYLQALSGRKTRPQYAEFKFLRPLVEKCRKRILEIELARGDTPTAASGPALSLAASIEGVSNLVATLKKLGKRNFVRGWARDNSSIETVLSHLARCSFSLTGETAADFTRATKEAGILEERLVEAWRFMRRNGRPSYGGNDWVGKC